METENGHDVPSAVASRHEGAAASGPRDSGWEQRLLEHARAALESGAFIAAERSYRELLAANPQHPDALHMLGFILFREGRLDEALQHIGQSVALRPTPLALANHAGVLATLGRREDALVDLERALEMNPAHPRALMQRAALLAELAHPAEALAAYDRLLAVVPDFVDGYCQRSTVLRTLGRLDDALASCDQALTRDARSFVVLMERGQVLQALGRGEEAADSYGRALVARPGSAEALYLRAMMHVDLGWLELALADFNGAIAAAPRFVAAIYNSAVVLERMRRFQETLGRCDRVIAIEPAHALAWANRGNALQGLGRGVEAVESYEKALDLQPHAVAVLCNQATALRRLGRREEALQACERALGVNEGDLEVWFARGRVLQGLHRYDDALASFDRVIAGNEANKVAHFHRANVLVNLRRHEEAKAGYERAIALDDQFMHAHTNRAFLCLSIGDFRNGWEGYEWRWKDPQMFGDLPKFEQPMWTGAEPLAGRTILVHAEQGLGDTLQFCRYVPMVKALGARVVLEAPPELSPVLAGMPGVDEFVPRERGTALPPFDLYCPLLSLPRAFGTELPTIPATVPYLKADPQRIEAWRSKLGPASRPRVGLVWSGNPKHLNDHNRSIAFADLNAMLTDQVEWISLQKVVREEDEAALAASRVRHFGPDLKDFGDTAALMENVDCVVSVDTSVAHLAGALGRPLWVLLPHTPDFRWLLDREDNPWYPQARLFRQSVAGEWGDVLARIRAALDTAAVPTANPRAFTRDGGNDDGDKA
jgi:tetratricopeptide (TPR) repeat protein